MIKNWQCLIFRSGSNKMNNRRAISAVLTTIIILVASIVLGTAVVVYSTSLFQTGGQQQAIQVQGVKAWINSTSQNGVYYSWGAAAIRNDGDKIFSVDTIQIRGTTIPFTNWYADANQTRVTSGSNFQAQYNITKNDQNGNPIGTLAAGGFITPGISGNCVQSTRGVLPYTTIVIDEDTGGSSLPLCLVQQSGPISLNPGDATIIYYKVPTGVLKALDSGTVTSVAIFAGKIGAPQSIRVSSP